MRKRKVLFLGRPYIMVACFVLSFVMSQAIVISQTFGQWQLSVIGPSEIPAGELVVLTADAMPHVMVCQPNGECIVMPDLMAKEPATTESIALPKLQYRWQVLPLDSTTGCYRVCDNGQTLVFSSRQIGCYHFVLAASDGENLQMITHTLLNIGETPKPVPLPPLPEPEPMPQPQREFEPLRDWAAQKTASLVRSDYFVREKAALAESMTDIAIRIRHGEITSAERARVELRVLTRRKLESVSRRSTITWQSWETELARQLSQLEQEGRLDSLEQVRAAFEAVADGLLTDQTAASDTKGDNRP